MVVGRKLQRSDGLRVLSRLADFYFILVIFRLASPTEMRQQYHCVMKYL